MDRSAGAVELDGSCSSLDIDKFSEEIIQLRKLSISHVERELRDLQGSVDQGMNDVMSQLLNEKDELKRNYEINMITIKDMANNEINYLKKKYLKQNKTLNEQKELLISQQEDQEIEEIITLLNSNLRSIKGKIDARSRQLEDEMRTAEDAYREEEASIESRAAEYKIALQQDVYDNIKQLKKRLVEEKKVLLIEETCYQDNKSDHVFVKNSNNVILPPLRNTEQVVDTPQVSLTPLTEGSDEEEGDHKLSPLVANKLVFSVKGKMKQNIPPEGGYSESDSDSDGR